MIYKVSLSEVHVAIWVCNRHLKCMGVRGWLSCATEPLTCGMECYHQIGSVRIENWFSDTWLLLKKCLMVWGTPFP